VLIVDDSALIRKELCDEFARQSFLVCAEAENGREAIAKARQCRPELIILDLSMPVLNGLDAAPELRKILPDCPIILYTAFAEGLMKSHVDALGITRVLSKNTPLEELIQIAEGFFQP
jgi:DNA-binding NarL/FixJ family response regulator